MLDYLFRFTVSLIESKDKSCSSPYIFKIIKNVGGVKGGTVSFYYYIL